MMPPSLSGVCKQSITALALLLWSGNPLLAVATLEDCRPLQVIEPAVHTDMVFADALLWKISRENTPPSYIFGTIHVADKRITDIPAVVRQALMNSSTYAMEALPDAEQSLQLTQMMFFEDGRTLQDFIGEQLVERTRTILSRYQLPGEMVTYMQPWAAFIIMNYPAEQGVPLDLHLLQLAEQNDARLLGLETLSEQGRIFATMAVEQQVRLLLDTVCNYETVSRDFDVMKSLYLQRDLQGLFDYSNRYSIAGESRYQELLQKLLFDRNRLMVDRMQSLLAEGNAFIAVGAMHLPGEQGILSLLDSHGYSITPVY